MYETSIRKVLTEIGKDADTITGDDINLWIAQELLAGKTKVSTDNYRRAISSFFDWLTKNDFIQKNPMNKVEVIKPEKKEKKAFTEIECARIRNACRNAREKAIVEMLFSTGCRVSELISIKTDDIHDGKVDILGKGAKWRTVFLNAEAQIAIESYMAERSDGNEYLFAGGKFKNPQVRERKSTWYRYKECVDEKEHLTDGTVESMIRKIGKRAGVKNTHPHRFRRTCATFALKRGMGVELVSKMLGHANIQTTQIYLDIGEEELENAHKKFVV